MRLASLGAASFSCSQTDQNNPSSTCTLKGANGFRVVYISNTGGDVMAFHFMTIRDGDKGYGAGLKIFNSHVFLAVMRFIDNAGGTSGEGGAIFVLCSATYRLSLQGCTFAGNTAQTGADIMQKMATDNLTIEGCPAGFVTGLAGGGTGTPMNNDSDSTYVTVEGVSYTCNSVCTTTGHSTDVGGATCAACPAGKFQLWQGYECQVCQGGRYSMSSGLTTCELCPGEKRWRMDSNIFYFSKTKSIQYNRSCQVHLGRQHGSQPQYSERLH